MTHATRFVAVLVALVLLNVSCEAPPGTRARAEAGDADAQFSLGVMYRTGRGVPQDDAEAVRWWRLAADQGRASAQYTVGSMYENGRGLPQDPAEAMRWYRLAADQGVAWAQTYLGNMYETGEGVPPSYVQAHMWHNLVASRTTGEQRDSAVEARDRVAGLMIPTQLAEAQGLAREWNEAHPREP
jgi:TPR repeat protein